MQKKVRLQSLDLLRGLTVMFMIIVNNGGGSEHYEALCHSQWNGMTPCDLVFPSFLFMVGMSIYMAFRKTDFALSRANVVKIVKRSVWLFAVGVLLHLWNAIVGRDFDLTQLPDILAHLRVWGVLQRIALSYLIVSLLVLYCNHARLSRIVIYSLLIYTGIIVFGHGYDYDSSTNIISIVDNAVCGYDHLYHKSPVDPEGLLGVIPSVAHVLLGFICCRGLMTATTIDEKLRRTMLLAILLIWVGYLMSWPLPLNKRIWSPSYTLLTCGMITGLLSLLIYIEDLMNRLRANRMTETQLAAYREHQQAHPSPAVWAGLNAFFVYILAEALEPIVGHYGINDMVYAGINTIVIDAKLASAIYAVVYMAFIVAVGMGVKKLQIKK